MQASWPHAGIIVNRTCSANECAQSRKRCQFLLVGTIAVWYTAPGVSTAAHNAQPPQRLCCFLYLPVWQVLLVAVLLGWRQQQQQQVPCAWAPANRFDSRSLLSRYARIATQVPPLFTHSNQLQPALQSQQCDSSAQHTATASAASAQYTQQHLQVHVYCGSSAPQFCKCYAGDQRM
jgi:hypothetical protein